MMMNKSKISVLSITAAIIMAVGCSSENSPLSDTLFESTSNNLFSLHSNGVTILCPDAEIGDTGVVNGTVYTKRTRAQITAENASTTCTSGITDMSELFLQAESFNQPIGSWDVSTVTNMAFMFFDAVSFNQTIENWDVSNVMDMVAMFDGSQFNQSIGEWDVSNVTEMQWMFRLSQFNQPIGAWDVSNVTNMFQMFTNSSFNQPINRWCVSQITSEPIEFSKGSPLSDENKPVWGMCP